MLLSCCCCLNLTFNFETKADHYDHSCYQAGEEVLARNQATQSECGASTVMLDQASREKVVVSA